MNNLLTDKAAEGGTDGIADAVDMSVLISLEAAQADGEPDLIVDLIDLYLEDTPRRLAAMSLQLRARDVRSLRREAHGVKGSSATLGAAGMARLCEAIEQLPHDRPSETAANLSLVLGREFARVREAFLAERHKRTNRHTDLRPG